jgi:hypothetical protein
MHPSALLLGCHVRQHRNRIDEIEAFVGLRNWRLVAVEKKLPCDSRTAPQIFLAPADELLIHVGAEETARVLGEEVTRYAAAADTELIHVGFSTYTEAMGLSDRNDRVKDLRTLEQKVLHQKAAFSNHVAQLHGRHRQALVLDGYRIAAGVADIGFQAAIGHRVFVDWPYERKPVDQCGPRLRLVNVRHAAPSAMA